MTASILVVGAGNMGGAILSGWLSSGAASANDIAVLDPRPGKQAQDAISNGATHLSEAKDIPDSIQTVLLGVKPQLFPQIRSGLSAALPANTLILSIMAGLSAQSLSRTFADARVVRAMPNTPASIGKGVTAYATDADTPADVIQRIETLLGATGTVLRVADDTQIDAVTSVSGSGPAYIFNLCEALAQAARSVGLEPDVADALARQTVIGASALLDASPDSPTALREAVTSPGGTTQAALDVLMASEGLAPLMQKAVQAAFDRACELSL